MACTGLGRPPIAPVEDEDGTKEDHDDRKYHDLDHLGAAAERRYERSSRGSHDPNGIAPTPRNRGYPASATRVALCALGDEVLGRRMRADDRIGGLLGFQLEVLAHGDADPVCAEQFDDLGVVGQLRAGRVAP